MGMLVSEAVSGTQSGTQQCGCESRPPRGVIVRLRIETRLQVRSEQIKNQERAVKYSFRQQLSSAPVQEHKSGPRSADHPQGCWLLVALSSKSLLACEATADCPGRTQTNYQYLCILCNDQVSSLLNSEGKTSA